VTPADAEVLTALRLANREYIRPWEPDTDDPERWFTVESVRAWITDGADRFVILDDGDVAGLASITGTVHGAMQSAMISYFVDEPRSGRGLATAAVAELLTVAFGELGLHRVEAGTAVDNLASQRVLEHNGFTRVGLLRRHLLLQGEWVDHYLWERLADDD
jgi:[ribosomal protein S5]-alanine N-acetyltransferase